MGRRPAPSALVAYRAPSSFCPRPDGWTPPPRKPEDTTCERIADPAPEQGTRRPLHQAGEGWIPATPQDDPARDRRPGERDGRRPRGKTRDRHAPEEAGRLNMNGGRDGRPWRLIGKPRRCAAGRERAPSPRRSDRNPRPVSAGEKTRPPARPGTRNVRRSRRARLSLAVESSGARSDGTRSGLRENPLRRNARRVARESCAAHLLASGRTVRASVFGERGHRPAALREPRPGRRWRPRCPGRWASLCHGLAVGVGARENPKRLAPSARPSVPQPKAGGGAGATSKATALCPTGHNVGR